MNGESRSHQILFAFFIGFQGFTSLRRLYLPPTKRLLVLLAPLVFDLEEMVLTAHLAVIGRITARRRVRLRVSGHNTLALVGALPGINPYTDV